MNSLKDRFKEIIEKIKSDNDFRKRFIMIASISLIVLIALIVLICVLAGRKKDTQKAMPDRSIDVTTPTPMPTPTISPTPTEAPTPTVSPTPTPNVHIGEARSFLTGEWVDEEIVKTRPYCIMFNNIAVANPQSGIGDAKILYEALTEAGITRLMGVFEGLTLEDSCAERIGSVRSARHYFASFADEYDAIFIHYGETTYATKKIEKLKLDHIEGIYGIGDTVYYRDKTIPAPHNAFASLKGIWAGIEKLGLRTTHEDGYVQNHFYFNEEPVVPQSASGDAEKAGTEAVKAENIKLPYSTYMTVDLTYDPETKLYTRYEFGSEHVDYNTNEPLRFNNIIIQVVNEYNKDKNGYQDMDISKHEGNGYYISMGKMVPITWKKNEKQRMMYYYDENGEILNINEGRTFISVFPNFREDKLVIE